MKHFGVRILKRLDEIGMTQEQFLKETGLSNYALWSWVKGDRWPNAYNVVLVAQALDRSTDWLLGVSNKPRRYGA